MRNILRNRSEASLPDLKGKRPSVAFDHRASVPTEPTDSEDFDWTMLRAMELLDSIGDQLLELSYLKEAAENTSAAVSPLDKPSPSRIYLTKEQLRDLLALKQQQAGVVEAREAVKQGEETLRQGRSIMLFTIVTIIFVSPKSSSNPKSLTITSFRFRSLLACSA